MRAEAMVVRVALFSLALACGAQSLTQTSGSGTGGSGAGGSVRGAGGASGDPGSEKRIVLPSTSIGFVEDPVSGVIGAWYAYGDGVGPNANLTTTDVADSDCVSKGGFLPAACSQIATPVPGRPFPPTDAATSKQCTSGVAAIVMNKDGAADYADLWGAGIGLDFNNPGGDAGVRGYFDLTPYQGIAFDFSADVLPNGLIRVSFPFQGMHGGDAPYWMGATTLGSPLVGTTANPQHVEIHWTDVGGPFYLAQEVPPVDPSQFPFTPPRAVQGIQLQVFTNTETTTPYSFCVANLALITDQ
jgi:hypothetical protein